MKTKEEVKSKAKSILKKVDEFIKSADEEKIIGRVVMLQTEVSTGSVDAMMELVGLMLYMEDEL